MNFTSFNHPFLACRHGRRRFLLEGYFCVPASIPPTLLFYSHDRPYRPRCSLGRASYSPSSDTFRWRSEKRPCRAPLRTAATSGRRTIRRSTPPSSRSPEGRRLPAEAFESASPNRTTGRESDTTRSTRLKEKGRGGTRRKEESVRR